MDISNLAVKLLILLIPGIISVLLIDALTIHKKWPAFLFFTFFFVIGFFNYALLFLFGDLTNLTIINLKTISVLFDQNIYYDQLKDICICAIGATIIGVITGLLLSALIYNKVLFMVARALRLSYKTGNVDIWSYYFTSQDFPGWVVVRDLEKDLMYQGWVRASTDSSDDVDELLLWDVSVYTNSTGELIYNADFILIPGAHKNMLIEKQTIQKNNKESSNE
ncbi:MAG: hypothetical protein HQ591_02595 [candidate division Zixibacteria bacterium]|nr:hypothetical protein [Candidatus Tariuqbacter arcticus]